MNSIVLLTGATGFLGAQIARQLLSRRDLSIVALVRAEKNNAAAVRLSRAWRDWPDLAQVIGTRVRALAGDVAEPALGLDPASYNELVRTTTHIVHTAADLRLSGSIDELRKTNVQGTANVLALARSAHRDHGLARLTHVSTAYVAGGRRGAIHEDSLTDEHGFHSAYELSKYEGERLVQDAKSELPISVFRPGLVVGDSQTGAIKTFNTLYFPLRLYLNGRLRVIPASTLLKINLVPVDYVAEAIGRLTFEPRAEGLNFHLTAPWEQLPSAGDLVRFAREWARQRLGIRLPHPLFVPMPASLARARYRSQKVIQQGDRGLLDTLITLAPYFNERRRFQRDNVDRLFGPYDFQWRKVLPALLEFAVYHGFFHRSERTVYEQVLFRLRSKNMPVTLYDIVDGQTVTRDSNQVRKEMLAAAEALRSMGIGKGDRVALVGLNSSRYLTMDVAIGLAGAVSVPLYYTSPPAEIGQILEDSGARLLFVGASDVMERLDEIPVDIPVVSFCRKPPDKLPCRPVTSWEEFLDRGSALKASAVVPVGLDALATVRYTSGTTGRAKGVCFDHHNLRSMAEATCAIMPWKLRNTQVTYLSFLPMNHVVEGIVAAYAPYYAPAPVQIYFLEDFHGLRQALPKVRPTVFFSVPRLYEKLWEGLVTSGLGRRYAASGKGLWKSLLSAILRRQLLRKSGLNRCAQLIVGSAPASEDLLRHFQELGIEVHNAYGLSEAPLVAMNRLGANRVGTVGEPLPKTEIRVADDGEVLVRGPQVARGYFAFSTEQPFGDGWLLTGDLGRITQEGSLVLEGRKKDLLKTSYAKYIQPAKIEALLKGIPGVDEALVVGEGRPFCSALLWVKGDSHGPWDCIEKGIVETNRHLSHPEQIKRWVILQDELSITRGDLTPNLKLKRAAVISRLSDVVEALYSGQPPASENVVEMGGIARQR